MSDGFSASRGASTLDTLGKTPDVVKHASLSIVTRIRLTCAGIA
ncbi:hypothetical protein HMPREF0970_01811 [Schaalia odontolytica F0309]|uniref:Uncharacterized protein n=1 Tax=Schaalia odontolytica F0309 TaxID=649742 RepID=D4U0R8_9ACTO|nr:hypothetical protein HMPREF0970_01811 [Schaalia odontolytica F0309]